MYHTTGLTKAQIAELRTRIEERGIKPGMRPGPPILGLRKRAHRDLDISAEVRPPLRRGTLSRTTQRIVSRLAVPLGTPS